MSAPARILAVQILESNDKPWRKQRPA